MRKFTLIFAALLFTTNSYSEIITVKKDGTGNFTSIQEAYQAASSNDTILVYPGKYYENLVININKKNITIASLNLISGDESYIYNTIIDGNRSGSTVLMWSVPQSNIVIHGFTIQNGSGHGNQRRGGGFFIFDAKTSIVNCIIENNNCTIGGGIHIYSSNLNLSGTTIRNNIAFGHGGGLAMSEYSKINFDTVNKCNIYLNHAIMGSDIMKTYLVIPQEIILDTFTVAKPDSYFILSADKMGNPVNDLSVKISHGLIEPVKSNLFVNPINGNDNNSGISQNEPLKTIFFAYRKIMPDSINSTNIFLSKGVYSHTTNGEKFPIQGRSYVNLIGADRDHTILDGDSTTFLFYGTNSNESYSIKNMTFFRGASDTLAFLAYKPGIAFNFTHNIHIENILFKRCFGPLPMLMKLHSTNSYIKDIELIDCHGPSVSLGYSFISDPPVPTNFRIKNLKANKNTPYFTGFEGSGTGLGLIGRLTVPNLFKGSVENMQITGHISQPDPYWGPRLGVALMLNNNVEVDIVNATIGHNILRGEEGYAVHLYEGAIMNLYNSILYADSLYEIVLGEEFSLSAPVTANICYSNIEGGQRQIYNWYNKHTLNWLEGNIDSDPEWIGEMPFPYQLRSLSPCINAGTPMYEQGMLPPYIKIEDNKIVLYKIDGDTLHLPLLDLAGNPRISAGRIDMGAYEFQDTGTYVLPHKPAIEPPIQMSIYPNPFLAHAFINFELKKAGEVTIVISDLNGRTVKTLLDAQSQPGEYNMIWKGNHDNGNTIPKGTYFVKFYYNDALIDTRKIVRN